MDDFATGYMAGQDSGGGNGGGWGGFGEGIWAVVIIALLFGRGNFGGGGVFGGGGGDGVSAGFAWQGIDNGIRGIQQGLCDGFYAVNTGLLNGFAGVDKAICSLGYNVQQGFNTLGYQQKDCCCETQRLIERGFCDVGQAVNMQTRDIIENQNANYRGIMDFLVSEKLASKDAQISDLRLKVSQADQNAVIRAAIDASTAEIIRRTGNECPVPAYVVPNPNCCYGNPLGVGYNYGGTYGGSGCGCA